MKHTKLGLLALAWLLMFAPMPVKPQILHHPTAVIDTSVQIGQNVVIGANAVIDPETCIGCGVCVYKCPTESLILERRESEQPPPKDVREWMKRWKEDQKAAMSE